MINRFRWAGICLILWMGAVLAPGALGQWNTPNPVVSFEKSARGLEVRQKDGVLRLDVMQPDMLHVTYAPLGAAAPERPSDDVVVKKDWPAAEFEVSSDEKSVTLKTAKMTAVI